MTKLVGTEIPKNKIDHINFYHGYTSSSPAIMATLQYVLFSRDYFGHDDSAAMISAMQTLLD
jgi:hypothetical protein